jgi:hypothetical protein
VVVVLGGCLVSGNDSAWSCSACGRRFGDREKSYKVRQNRARDEWLEHISTMLPSPVRTNEDGELLAGDPVVVIVRIDADAISIMEASIDWQGAHSPTLKGLPFAKVPLRAFAVRVTELIALAWGKGISEYRWCPQCRRRVEPEHMLAALCHGYLDEGTEGGFLSVRTTSRRSTRIQRMIVDLLLDLDPRARSDTESSSAGIGADD